MIALIRALLAGRIRSDQHSEALPRTVIWRLWNANHRAPTIQMPCGCTRYRLTRRMAAINGNCAQHFDVG